MFCELANFVHDTPWSGNLVDNVRYPGQNRPIIDRCISTSSLSIIKKDKARIRHSLRFILFWLLCNFMFRLTEVYKLVPRITGSCTSGKVLTGFAENAGSQA